MLSFTATAIGVSRRVKWHPFVDTDSVYPRSLSSISQAGRITQSVVNSITDGQLAAQLENMDDMNRDVRDTWRRKGRPPMSHGRVSGSLYVALLCFYPHYFDGDSRDIKGHPAAPARRA